MNTETYNNSTIQQFINSRSRSISEKVRQTLFIDTVLKVLLIVSLIVNLLFYSDNLGVLALCLSLVLLLGGLVYFQMGSIRELDTTIDPGQDTRRNLSSLLTFLESRFNTTAATIASTNPTLFVSGLLIYFYSVYGGLRQLDATDLAVFGILGFIGGAIGFVTTKAQVKYFKKHLKLCLSDLNEEAIEAVASNIEARRKQDRSIKLLLGLVFILGLVVFLAVLKTVIG